MSKHSFLKPYQKNFVLAILLFSTVLMALQLIVEYTFQDRVLAADVILSITSFILLIHYYFVRDIESTSFLLAIAFFLSAILLFISASYVDPQTYIWILFAPVFIYYLIDFEKAKKWVITLLVLLLVFSILVFLKVFPAVLYPVALLQAYIALLFFSIMSHFFQKMTFLITTILDQKNEYLELALDELHKTQETLIASEKMASLGSLVAGVSHEVNTPVGVALTGISQIGHETAKLEKAYLDDKMDEGRFLSYLDSTKKLSGISEDSLMRAAKLIQSFKEISVDQHLYERREINLKKYMDEIVITLSSELKNKHVIVTNTIPDDIYLNTYAGLISQVFSNLILNAYKHAFDVNGENRISISATQEEGKTMMTFRDNGKGVNEEVAQKLFDPFFTTARGRGGSGLGLNIVYNLITSKLNGEIAIDPAYKEGLGFIIEIGETDGES